MKMADEERYAQSARQDGLMDYLLISIKRSLIRSLRARLILSKDGTKDRIADVTSESVRPVG